MKLEQLGKSLNTMAKLHHNREFMEMAMARNLPPRRMQLDLSCTLLNKTPTTEEQWEQIPLKASNNLVKLAHNHYTNQVESELKQQKILLQEIKELTNHHSLTRAENCWLPLEASLCGGVCYADDLALLAPSQAALRLMLRLCEQFADLHGLRFNPSKTQLIHFGRQPSVNCFIRFSFCSILLPFLNSVVHLGHILQYDIDDYDDIL